MDHWVGVERAPINFLPSLSTGLLSSSSSSSGGRTRLHVIGHQLIHSYTRFGQINRMTVNYYENTHFN